jgi:hypothetical protein
VQCDPEGVTAVLAAYRMDVEGPGSMSPVRKVSGRERSRGQSLVEFALIFPVVLLLTLIAIDFGRIYLGWINLEQMARIAANHAADHASAWETPGDPLGRRGETRSSRTPV